MRKNLQSSKEFAWNLEVPGGRCRRMHAGSREFTGIRTELAKARRDVLEMRTFLG